MHHLYNFEDPHKVKTFSYESYLYCFCQIQMIVQLLVSSKHSKLNFYNKVEFHCISLLIILNGCCIWSQIKSNMVHAIAQVVVDQVHELRLTGLGLTVHNRTGCKVELLMTAESGRKVSY